MPIRRSLTSKLGLGMFLLGTFAPRLTRAQSAPAQGPLPQLPPDDGGPPSHSNEQPQQGVEVAPAPPQTAVQVAPPPSTYRQTTEGAPGDYPEPKHAPRFSFYVGGDLGAIGYGGQFFTNNTNFPETTRNLVGSGLSFEIDAGARLGKRYIPYIFWEHGFLAPGRRFDGTDAHASSDFVGLGFRLIAGDVDSVGFLSELAFGFRTVTIANDSETFQMSSLEIARLGLGAEIRLSTLFTISPIARISVGQMSQSSGSITYRANQGDGQTGTTFEGGDIGVAPPRDYVVVGLGCGGHFDFFGK